MKYNGYQTDEWDAVFHPNDFGCEESDAKASNFSKITNHYSRTVITSGFDYSNTIRERMKKLKELNSNI